MQATQRHQLTHHSQVSSTHKPLHPTGLSKRSSISRLNINSKTTTTTNSSNHNKHRLNNSRSSNNNSRIDQRQMVASRCLVLEEDRSTVSTQTATALCGIRDQNKLLPVTRALWLKRQTPTVVHHPVAILSRPV